MVSRCARCPWQPDPYELDVDGLPVGEALQLEVHAVAAGHPLCAVCGTRSLEVHERQSCERCLARAQEHLAGIGFMYDELPAHLALLRGQALSGDRPGSADGRPLPGGDALVLLGPGSEGLAEDGVTSRAGDATSVAWELSWWEEEWRDARDEWVARGARSARAVVRGALGYLETRMRWAATSHPGFAEFAGDLRLLHGRLERATGRVRRPSTANASCFGCGGRLVHQLREVATTGTLPDWHWWLPGAVGPLPALELPEAIGLVEEDEVTCDRCGRTYDGPRYLLALRGAVEAASRLEVEGVLFVTVEIAAQEVERSRNTVKKWAVEGSVRQVQSVGRRMVALEDVRACDAARPRRRTA